MAMGAHRINLSWLVKLRWGAIVGQLVTIAAVHWLLQIRLPLLPLFALVAVEIVSNVIALGRLRRGGPISERWLVGLMAFDVTVLTGLLFFTGGPFNPFSFLYLVHIALATVVLRRIWTWVLVVLSLGASGGLFFSHVWLNLDASHGHLEHINLHLQGMWIASAVAAGFIGYFVTRIRAALAEREADLAAERTVTARNEKLAALATLSAGAAHELATPLATIAVVAKELERHAAERPELIDDIRLIRAQVDRCRAILDQMAADAGEGPGEGPEPISVEALLSAAIGATGEGRTRMEIDGDSSALRPRLPARALVQGLRAVIKNAEEASPGKPVVVRAACAPGTLRIEVVDRGPGMSPEVLSRVGEPFFTTKAPGEGMGLGVFLARTIIERIGGSLRIESAAGAGTRVAVSLPTGPEVA
jgi:two-component system sensor histidine kinase RegB